MGKIKVPRNSPFATLSQTFRLLLPFRKGHVFFSKWEILLLRISQCTLTGLLQIFRNSFTKVDIPVKIPFALVLWMFPVNLDHVWPFMRFVLNTHMCIHIYLIVLLHMVFQHSTYVFQHHLLKHIYLQQFSKKKCISKHWFLKHANLPRKKKKRTRKELHGQRDAFPDLDLIGGSKCWSNLWVIEV